MRRLTIILVHLFAALVPFLQKSGSADIRVDDFTAWPTELNGVELTRLALTEQERGFNTGFPGKIARFAAGDQEVVIRLISQPSRKLHPSADCLRGAGYRITPQPAQRDRDRELWGCVLAEKVDQRLRVCEQIKGSNGGRWYDVSSWYWAALLGRTSGPWWAVTVAKRFDPG